jgi:hypothetical protein
LPKKLSSCAVVGLGLRDIQVADRPGLIIGELVVRREKGVGLAVALDLSDLVEGLPHGALGHVVLVQRRAVPLGLQREHDAVGEVAVVGDGEHVAPGLGLVVGQPLPEITRVVAALWGIGGIGHRLRGLLTAVAVDDNPVHVVALDQ